MALIAIVNGTIAKATLFLTLATWGQTYPTLNFGLLGQLNDLGFGHAWQLFTTNYTRSIMLLLITVGTF